MPPFDSSHTPPHLVFSPPYGGGTTKIPILEMRKLRLRDYNWPMVLTGRARAGSQGALPRSLLFPLPVSGRDTWGVGAGRWPPGALRLTLPGHKVNLDLCKRRKSRWYQGKGPATGAPPPPGHQLTHEVELGRQVAGEALRYKAVVSLIRRCDVVNGQFVDPAGQRWLRGPH